MSAGACHLGQRVEPQALRRRGFNAGAPVLTPDQVRAIRARAAEGATFYRMARDYRVSAQAISKIVRGAAHKGVV